jgi:hypothetical protein
MRAAQGADFLHSAQIFQLKNSIREKRFNHFQRTKSKLLTEAAAVASYS